MSRVFDSNFATSYIDTPSSAVYNNLPKLTIAQWVNASDFTPPSGSTQVTFVKDPTVSYQYWGAFTGPTNTWASIIEATPSGNTFPARASDVSAHSVVASNSPALLQNDILIAAVWWSDYNVADTLTVTDNHSNTWTTIFVTGTAGKTGMGMAWARIAADNSITVTATIPAPNRTGMQFFLQGYRGLKTTGSPVDVFGHANLGGASNTVPWPTLTPTNNGEAGVFLAADATGTHNFVSVTGQPPGVNGIVDGTFPAACTGLNQFAAMLVGGVAEPGSTTWDGTPDADWLASTVWLIPQVIPTNAAGFKFGDEAASSASLSITTNEIISVDAWHHIAVTFDSTGDRLARIYLDGVETTYTTQTAGAGAEPDDSGSGWFFGGDTGGDSVDASIAEVAIWNTVLTPAQIATLASSTTGADSVARANLVGYWHLCGISSPEPDSSGNNNSATLGAHTPAAGADGPGFVCAVAPTPPTASAVGGSQGFDTYSIGNQLSNL